MKTNTYCENSRPRSVKPKKRTGFTMMEMMITLAIMAILFGLAVPAVAAIQKNLEMARLNSYAKDIYLAAQNRLTSLKATGELVELRDVLQEEYSGESGTKNRYYGPTDPDNMDTTSFKPQDWDDSWDSATSVYKKYYNFYGIMHNPLDASDNDAVVTEIIPELSVTSTSLDHHYYIEFNPTTGDVYAAFYTDAKTGFTSADIKKLERGDQADGSASQRRKAYLRDDFVNEAGDNVMVGYYRGDPTDMLEDKEITEYDVTCELVNKEDLYIKVTCDLGDTYFLRKFVEASITLTNADTGAAMEIPINLAAADSLRTYDRSMFATNNFMMFGYDATETTKFVAYVLLDAADSADILNGTAYSSIIEGVVDKYKDADANTGKDLTTFAAAVEAGCNLQASANVELNFADRIVRTNTLNSTDEHLQHSRFAAVADGGKTVKVGYVRHLKNLDGYNATGNQFTIEQSCVEYVVETYIDEVTGEEKTRTVEKAKGDIYFNSKYESAGGDTKWYWTSDYLIGEPKGDALRNYLNAPEADDEAYLTPINFTTAGNNKPVTYNGKHYGLYDFVIAGADANKNTGLFGKLINATVKDVNMIDATVDGKDTENCVGGFVGQADTCQFSNVGVRLTDRDPVNNQYYTDMETRVSTKKVSSESAAAVGGIVGLAGNCTFDYSYAAVQVEGDSGDSTVGGLVGFAGNCTFTGCYTSEPTIGGENVGGFVGLMQGGSAEAEQNGTSVYPLYATGDVTGSVNVGGFVGKAAGGAIIDGCNSYGRVRATDGATGSLLGGFVGQAVSGTSFSNNSYLKQTRYNTGTGFLSQDGYAVGRSYTDATAYNGNSYWNVMTDKNNDGTLYTDNDNTAEDSHPYTVYTRSNVFPFVMTQRSMTEGYDEIPHYGDWPVEASIQTMLAYYEVYENDDGSTSVGLYGNTSLVGESAENANKWALDTLQTGDTYCVEDGYAIVSTDLLTNISGTISTLSNKAVSVNYTQADFSVGVSFKSDGSNREENVYVYKLSDLDVQGMSSDYQARMSDPNGTYFQKMVLSGVYNSDEVFTDYTFFYCPVLAKSAINPTPAQTEDPSLCPTSAAMEINKPETGIVRSARQLNAMGRMNWFWTMNLSQECHVDFGKYTKSYCDTLVDLSSTGQVTSNQWRNKPIGSNTTTYGEKPYTGTYDGEFYKIIDYCLFVSEASDSTDVGLFGLLYKGTVKNVVLSASDPKANSGAGSAWVKSTMTQGNGNYNIAPLVGQVKYDSTSYTAMGGLNRVLDSWGISGSTFHKDRSSLDTTTGKLTIKYNQGGTTSGATWSSKSTDIAPQNSHQFVTIAVTGEFGMASTATLNTYHGSTLATSIAAKTITNNTLLFEMDPADCEEYETGKYRLGATLEVVLTGGDMTGWTYDNTSVTVELHSDEPLVPTGDDPADYLTKLSNMSTVENCAVAGYVVDYTPAGTQTKAVNMGGLVGNNQGEVYNCSASNKRLAATGSSGGSWRNIGGLAGINNAGVIADCYSGGLLMASGSQPAYVGGVVAKQEGAANTWHAAGTMLLSSYSYCQIEKNASASTIYYNGVAGGSDSMVKHSHFYENSIKDYSEDVFNALGDKSKTYTATINKQSVSVPYSLTYAKMKRLFSGSAYALSGDTGTANYDHSWPYDQTLVGSYPFPAAVKASDGYYVHYGDWPAPNGTIYNNSASFSGVFWVDFVVDAIDWKTDYSYYWGEWLKEMKYQAELGAFQPGDFIEIIVEPEFLYDAPDACGLFQCCIHTMLADTSKNVWDDENDAAYEAQGINFGNGQVYQFLFDVEALLNIDNDPQLWFAINYHSKGGLDGSLWENVRSNYNTTESSDPFRLNRLTVNVYRADSSTTTTNGSTRKSTTSTGAGGATEADTETHLELLKEWTFENGEANILSTAKGTQLAGDISTTLWAGNTESGHSNHIELVDAESFRMDISSAFGSNEPALLEGECYQVEATFALGDDATKDMSMRPYLVSGDDIYYASTYTLVQKRADSGANKGKVIWANALYTFGEEGMVIDDDAYIVWVPRETTSAGTVNKLNGNLYVDNVSVKKVAQGPDPSSTASTTGTLPFEEDGKLIAHWECDYAANVQSTTDNSNPENDYRKISINSCVDPHTHVKWSDFVKNLESLSDSQYMVVTLQYPEGYAHAERDDFTFTCDSFAYRSTDGGEGLILSEIDADSGDNSFDATSRTVTWVLGGPLMRSAVAEFGHNTQSYFMYRNALDLINKNVLKSNEDEFNIEVDVYDRDPNATAMPTSATTKALSGGSVGHSWVSQTGELSAGDNLVTATAKGTTETGATLTFAEFVAQNTLDATQYLRVTVTASDSGNPLVCSQPSDTKMNLKAYVDGNNEEYDPIEAESISGNSVVYHVNGALTPVAGSERMSFSGLVATNNNNGRPLSVAGLQVLVEVMNTTTTATLQGDNFDIQAGDVVSETATITLNGDTFTGLATNDDITSWFNGIGGRGLTARVAAVNANVLTVSITGTVTATPESTITVTATVPGANTALGGADLAANGSFEIRKKIPRATIVGDTTRSFYVNEAANTVVNIQLTNDTFTDSISTTPTDWFTGSLPSGWTVQVAKVNATTVSLTFSGTPDTVASIPLTFKAPAASLTVSGADLTAGTVTFSVIERPKVATPTFGLAAGTYRGNRTVSISCATADADVYYKVDSATDWTLYVNPVLLTEGTHTIYAKATKTDYVDSDEVNATYIIVQDNNLLKNGFFDDGLTGWTVSNSGTSSVSVVNGVLTVSGFASGSNDLVIDASLKDGYTIKANTTYRFSFNMNADTGLKVKVVPGGNKATTYAESGSYTFTTNSDPASTFKIYISAPKGQTAVSGTFDNFELTEESGGTSETSTVETTKTSSSATVTTQTSPESSTTESSTPSGSRTKVAQWVTTNGVSYTYLKSSENLGEIFMYGDCAGMKDGSTAMTWKEFIASVGNVSSNQYFEIAYTHTSGSSFYGVVKNSAGTSLENNGYSPSATTVLSADDVKVLFETNGALTYAGADNPQLLARFGSATGVPANTDVICTVTLYEGNHSGETSEVSETSTSETSSPEIAENLIVNGYFSNGLTGWTQDPAATGEYAGFFAVTDGKLNVTIPGYRSPALIPSYTEQLKAKTEYTLHVDMTTSGSANDKIKVKVKKDNNTSYNLTSTGDITFTTPSDMTNFEISIAVTGNSTGLETAVIDNVILVEGDHIPSGGTTSSQAATTASTAASYTITVTGGNADKATAHAGETVTLTPPSSGSVPEGKEFTGWNVTAGGVTVTDNTFTMPAANVVIAATYDWIEYNISVSNGDANGKSKAHLGETIQINAASPETGKEFANWTVNAPAGLTLDDATAAMTTFTMPAADVSLTANFNNIDYTITVNSNNSSWGTAQVVGGATTANYGGNVTLRATPETGYEFVNWTVNAGGVSLADATENPVTFVMQAASVSVTANFQKIVVPTYTVTVTDGTVTGLTASETVEQDSTVSITANTPETGYRFVNWTSADGVTFANATSATTSFTMPHKNVTVVANYAKTDFTVTCNAVSNGTISASPTTAQMGDSVTLTATPATGYDFGGWNVTGGTLTNASSASTTLTMPADNVTVSATFVPHNYTITVTNDTTKGTVSAPSTAVYNGNVSITVTPKTGWIFSGFTSSDVTPSNTSSGCTFTMPAKNVTLTATYTMDTVNALATWSTTSGAGTVNYSNGTATVGVDYNTIGTSGKTFEAFMNGVSNLSSSQYMKVTYTKSNGKFGNARRAATTTVMNALSGGTTMVASADDSTIVAYVVGAATKTADPSFTTSWTNASAVPATTDITVTVEIFNFETSPISGISTSDVTADYTISVTGGTASVATAKANNSVTVTPTVPSGKRFTGWTVDGTDYLYVATVAPGSTANPLTFTMPYNNVTLTANFENLPTYSVTCAGGLTGGSITADKSTALAGETVTLTATPDSGYTFGSWSVTGATVDSTTSATTTFTMPAGPVNVTATFVLEGTPTNLIVNGDFHQTNTSASDFGWSNTGTKTPIFGTNSITVNCGNSEGTGLVQTVNGLTVGTTYTLTATSAAGSDTVAMLVNNISLGSIAGGTTQSYTFTATSTSATIEFYKYQNKTFTLSNISLTGPGGGATTASTAASYSVTCADGLTGGSIATDKATAHAGETVTLTATPDSGYTFGSWTVTGATVDSTTSATTTFTMPAGPVNVTATFEAESSGGTNLLTNGDFSQGTTGWTSGGTSFTVTDGVATFKNGHNAGDKGGLYQMVSFVSGHSYTLTCDITNLVSSKQIKLSLDGTTTPYTGITTGAYSVTFTASSGMNQICFTGDDRNFTLDNVVLVDNDAS